MRRYLFNLLLALDQLGNSLYGGHPDETVSSRLGRWKLRKMAIGTWPPPWYHPGYWLERGLDALDPNHVLDAIEPRFSEASVVWNMKAPRRRETC